MKIKTTVFIIIIKPYITYFIFCNEKGFCKSIICRFRFSVKIENNYTFIHFPTSKGRPHIFFVHPAYLIHIFLHFPHKQNTHFTYLLFIFSLVNLKI